MITGARSFADPSVASARSASVFSCRRCGRSFTAILRRSLFLTFACALQWFIGRQDNDVGADPYDITYELQRVNVYSTSTPPHTAGELLTPYADSIDASFDSKTISHAANAPEFAFQSPTYFKETLGLTGTVNGPGELHAVQITTTRHFLWWFYKDCQTDLPNEDNPVPGVATPFNFQWRAAANNRRLLHVTADGRTRRLQTDPNTTVTLDNSTTDTLLQGNPVRPLRRDVCQTSFA